MTPPPMSNAPTVAVVGAGAIGGAMAAALGDAGHPVRLCVRTPFERLTRALGGERSVYPHPVHTDPSTVAPVDWVLLCTKAHQVADAAPWLDRLVGPDTRIAVMQNGVDHPDRVQAWVPAARAVPCVILMPASVNGPGAVVQGRNGVVQVPVSDAGRALERLFRGQDAVRIEPTADFVSALWSKLILNAVGGAICALSLTPLRAMAAPEVHDLAVTLIQEVMAVGRAEGATLPDDCPQATIDYFNGPIGEHWTSMAVDRREGRAMEWDARNAVVGRIGRRHGIPTPMNDAMTALLAVSDAARAGGAA